MRSATIAHRQAAAGQRHVLQRPRRPAVTVHNTPRHASVVQHKLVQALAGSRQQQAHVVDNAPPTPPVDTLRDTASAQLESLARWVGLPQGCQSTLSLAFIPLMPFATIKFSPWTALLFTALVTWSLTSGVLSVIRMLADEASAPMNVVKLQLVLTSEAHGLRQELKELEQYYHARNTNDLYYLVEECLHEVGKRWEHCRGGGVQVRSSSSYREAHRIFDDQASQERARARACPSDGPMFGQQTDAAPAGAAAAAGSTGRGGILGWMSPGRFFGGSVTKRLGRVFAGRRAREDNGADGSDELVVVTLVLLTTRSVSLPQPGDGDRVQAAVEQLRGLTTGQILDAQLLWTPGQQVQYISRDTLQRVYPDLA